MADEVNPYAKFVEADNPYAKFVEQKQPEYAGDVLTAIPVGVAKGVMGLAGTGGDLQQIAKAASDKATEKGVNPFSFLGKKIEESKIGQWLKKESAPYQNTRSSGDLPGSYELPTSAGIKSAVEGVTGKLPEAQTGPGKAVQTAFEVAPALALGPTGGLRGLVAKSAGAGIVSELAGEGADAIKDKLPEKIQPWAEPVARAAGAIAGSFTPSGARKAITPLPMSDEQFATVNALRARDPNFPMSAGQATESPRLMGLEARSPMAKNMEANQERAFTANALREAGVPGNDFRNIGQGKLVGEELGNIRRGNNMTDVEFKNLQKVIAKERADLSRTTGPGNIKALNEIRDEVRNGASGVPGQALNMTGKRYEWMRDHLQGKIDAAASPQEAQAISRIRKELDRAYKASVPADVAERLTTLENQYANYNVLNKIPSKAGREGEVITPQQVQSAVGKNWGNAAANEGRGSLVPLSRDAARVMTPHPAPGDRLPPLADLAMASIGGVVGHGAESAVLGHLLASSVYNAGANAGSRAIASTPVQAYLRNQAWRPGASSTTSRDELVRLLMAPTVQGQ